MKLVTVLSAAALLAGGAPAIAQLPPGVTPEMIASSLPEEGAPRARPGAHAVISAAATCSPGLKVFHPRDLATFPARDTLPVVVWGNGGCAIDGPRYAGLLETIASHGFLVVTTTAAPGASAPAAAGGPPPRATAQSLAAGIDWAEKENARSGSPLAGKVATDKVAVMGQSCGGRLSIELGADPRVDTIGVFNAGLQPDQFELLGKLHGPVLLINGHERDFMYAPSKATFDAIDNLPVFYGARHGAGHTATAYHAGGGEFANVAANWLRWQFKGDGEAGRMFTGADCTLCSDANWEVAARRITR